MFWISILDIFICLFAFILLSEVYYVRGKSFDYKCSRQCYSCCIFYQYVGCQLPNDRWEITHWVNDNVSNPKEDRDNASREVATEMESEDKRAGGRVQKQNFVSWSSKQRAHLHQQDKRDGRDGRGHLVGSVQCETQLPLHAPHPARHLEHLAARHVQRFRLLLFLLLVPGSELGNGRPGFCRTGRRWSRKQSTRRPACSCRPPLRLGEEASEGKIDGFIIIDFSLLVLRDWSLKLKLLYTIQNFVESVVCRIEHISFLSINEKADAVFSL